jgi:L,D-transpeptidase ErfK/SrfK
MRIFEYLRGRQTLALVAATICGLGSTPGIATVYELREDGGGVFGNVERITVRREDTLIELARRFSLGYEELTRVNPKIDPWLPGEGAEILIPGQRVLPAGERTGIVVNLPEHRLYYFPKPKRGEKPIVMTFPVSVGKMDWRTPLGETKVVAKVRNPSWTPPASVRKEHEARGEPLPKVVPPGPDNPLGTRSMRLGIPGGSYLIHGTNNPDAVGMAVTHGCLRMYPEDVERLFDVTPVGTRVALINEPIKIARVDGEVWLEVHPPVNSEGQRVEPNLAEFEQRLDTLLGPSQTAIHWDRALEVLRAASGIPAVIGLEIPEEETPAVDPAAPTSPAEPGLPAQPGSPAAPPALTAPAAATIGGAAGGQISATR